MQTRRDLYQAHRLMMQRVGMALLAGEPDMPEPPTRRLNVLMFGGAMAAILILAGFGIWGLLSPGGATGLEKAGTLIIEKETGTKYVFGQQDGKLYPVANYTSARLILGTPQIERRTVSQASLAKFDRGRPIGILGAPDSLPDAAHQVRSPWSICVQDAPTSQGGTRSYSSLVVGRSVGGRTLGDGEAVVVRGGGQAWVVWRNQRMRLPAALVVPLVGTQQPPEVSTTWLNAVPQGPDFQPPPVPGRGELVPGPGGQKAAVGTFYVVRTVGGDEHWYVLMNDGLAPIKQSEGWLLQNDPESAKAYKGGRPEPISLAPATANASPRSSQKPSADGMPETMPKVAIYDPATPLCSVYADTTRGSLDARVSVGGTVPPPNQAAPAAAAGTGKVAVVDQVVLPPGSGALVGLLPGANQLNAVSSYSVLTDQGLRFPVPSADVATKLGFDVKKVAPVPANLLSLIPVGPSLDPQQASLPLTYPRSAGGQP
ncbi:type VII secretion protein EccB [Actinoallomurus rhizosphaericola]|uniref:type VII secretion protein EccB n=1 Tax=Actinoallomurus rhizosphaericola TaxID=2952536 RepID=UPI002093BD65|nr:type VII secretion protein EccB [Actinoallomurus rhizosphaericola]MCO5996126.1 type VII secretion protein EccB [Actinoallomurus rhizosphaericola]